VPNFNAPKEEAPKKVEEADQTDLLDLSEEKP